MSNKSGASSQIISLPQGGGALQGIGEKFAPELFTGTGNFAVPIALPPGRNGFQPQLNLSYSTGNGNGPFGLGWSLSVPGVSRKISKGVPRYDDSKDVFILSGDEDLVAVEESATKTRYRPRTEGLFARIERHHDAENDYWQVWSKDGLVSFYGTPGAAGNDPAVVADPSDPTKVFAWQLTQTVDPFGNRIEYEYWRDAGHDPEHHWRQLYLKEIRYVNYTDDDGSERFLVSVAFDYGDADEERPDPFSDYRAGFEIRTTKRCRRIVVRTHAGRDCLVRSYDLVYLDQRDDLENLAHLLPPNGVSLLSQMRVTGHDGEATESLPPLEFSYTRFEPERRDFFPLPGTNVPARSLADPDLELADLFGNGLPDILEMNGIVRYWRNLGGGRFDLPRQMQEAPAGLSLADPGVQLIDADGDGRVDLLATVNGLSGYFPLRFGGLWDRRSFQRYRAAPSFDLKDPEVKLVDLDGDGVTDAIRSGSRLECFFNDPQEGWNNTRQVERRTLDEFPNISFADPRVKWGDMSGDGLQDIVLLYDGNVEYWPNMGHGNWGRRIHMRHSPRLPYDYDPRRILIGDVDGDGLADVVYVEDTQVTLWINQSGNGWSDPIVIRGTPPVSDMDAVRLADVLGSGVSGVLWSRDAGGLTRENYHFLDFTGGVKPYLLSEMDNHMGAVTRVEYASSTQYYLEDQKRPETRWQTPLPFPVLVVARVEVLDAISGGKLTTEYRYHHGYWDGAEREFRGFGRVDQRDTETFERYHAPGLHPEKSFETVAETTFSPPLETRTWFHQGPIGDEFGGWEESDYSHEFWAADPNVLARPSEMATLLKNLPRRTRRDALRALRGRILRTELYALDGAERQARPYTVTEYLHGVREESSPGPAEADRLRIFFPHSLAQRTTQWERGAEPMTRFGFTDDYDDYGQPRAQVGIAVPRGRDFRLAAAADEPYLATLTETAYAQRDDVHCYMIDRLACTTSYEILNNGTSSLFDLQQAIQDGAASRRIVGQMLNFYDGPAFQGLSFGQLGDYGALARTETLALTADILRQAYRSSDATLSPPEEPPYLAPGASPAWTDEYPQEFRDRLPALAGYTCRQAGAESEYAAGYFAAAERRCYDFQSAPGEPTRGLMTASRDPLGRDTTIAYDAYDLLPSRIVDPAGLIKQTVYDYRVLQPAEVTDANGNRSAFAFTPLGMLACVATMGKVGQDVGDTLETPGTQLVYDLRAYVERGQPVSVRTVQRLHHVNDADVPLPERDETLEKVEYSDGLGRLLQTRLQAEDVAFGDPTFGGNVLPIGQEELEATRANVIGRQRANGHPNVVVSGWQIYDNKGRVVEKYEPFFSAGWDYAPPGDAERGQKATIYYDPRGQMIRTVSPDGSEQRIVYGVPGAIASPDFADPDAFEPTPWEGYTYDAGDNAGRTHPGSAADSAHCWNTPSSVTFDALGRTVLSVARSRTRLANGSWSPVEEYRTQSTYDVRGNLLTVTDALSRLAFRYVYDLTPQSEEEEGGAQVWRIEQLDGGVRRMVFDAAGNEIERRDSKGALVLRACDALNRPLRLWARDGAAQPMTLRGRLVYGDAPDAGLSGAEAQAANLLGALYRHYDEAGLLTFEACDFKGNVLEKVRRVISDEAILSAFDPPPPDWQVSAFRVSWQPPAGSSLSDWADSLLDAAEYRTSLAYDGLNRLKAMRYPQDVDGTRQKLCPRYNRAGALESVELDGAPYVAHVAYDAKGQRTLVAYGNGVMTRYAYDPQTFRLARLRSERYTQPEALTYRPNGRALQDCAYEYDPAGNITAIRDRAPECGLPAQPDRLDRAFTYDPLYRLISATGRECDSPRPAFPWEDAPQGHDVTRTRGYSETYSYDPVGNVTQMRHTAHNPGNVGGFTRSFSQVPGANRLQTMTVGNGSDRPVPYTYDANGNLTGENTARHFEWDHSDRMQAYRTQTEGTEPSVHTHYLYDAGGQRVKKLTRKQGGQVEVTVYVDGVFEHHRQRGQENNTLHVMDDQQRLATVRVGEPFADDTTPAVKYHLGDHLGSSNVVVDDSGDWIDREEYTPYGETSFGSFSHKHYRFSGKERDTESGLVYFGYRYYAPGLARWICCDPAFSRSASSPYVYAANRPLILVDPDGLWPWVALIVAVLIVAEIIHAVAPTLVEVGNAGALPQPSIQRHPSHQSRFSARGPGATFERRAPQQQIEVEPIPPAEVRAQQRRASRPTIRAEHPHRGSHGEHGSHAGHQTPHTHPHPGAGPLVEVTPEQLIRDSGVSYVPAPRPSAPTPSPTEPTTYVGRPVEGEVRRDLSMVTNIVPRSGEIQSDLAVSGVSHVPAPRTSTPTPDPGEHTRFVRTSDLSAMAAGGRRSGGTSGPPPPPSSPIPFLPGGVSTGMPLTNQTLRQLGEPIVTGNAPARRLAPGPPRIRVRR